MIFAMKKALVWFLEAICTHRWPLYCRPATLSADLDEKWGTNIWYGPDDPRFVEPKDDDDDE